MASGTSYPWLPPRNDVGLRCCIATVAARTLECEVDGSVPAPSAASMGAKNLRAQGGVGYSASDRGEAPEASGWRSGRSAMQR